MEDHLDAIISLLEKRSLKGISNADRNLFRNFGFINEKAVEIDFGNYNYSKDLCLPAKRKEEISRFLSSLRTWLQGNAPEWVFYLDQQTNF